MRSGDQGEECETPAAEAPEMLSPHYDPSAACSARSVHRPKKQRIEFTCAQTHNESQKHNKTTENSALLDVV